MSEWIAGLPLTPFEFRGYLGNRRTLSFGWRYDYARAEALPAEPVPGDLRPLRARAAAFAGLDPENLVQALVTEYAPGAGIGWHLDKPAFDEIIGVSLLAPCRFRLRREGRGGWTRAAFTAEPRSAYLLSGEARTAWEHSIAPMDRLRYSITFRSLRR